MKATFTLLALVACLAPALASAQPTAPPAAALPRRDAAVSIGWLNGNKTSLSSDGWNDWYNNAFYGGASAGWFWTDHLKTEVEVGTSNTAELSTYATVFINGAPTGQNVWYRFRTSRVAIGQQYQFFRNAWFHPHVTAGADLIWETSSEDLSPIQVYDSVTRQYRTVRPAVTRGPETRFHARPYGELGFKTYMTQSVFFRSDLRLTFHSGVEQVVLRFGLGVDW